MAKTKAVRALTTASLPYDLRIPSNTAALVKTLGKLSRQSLLDLVLLWLSKPNVQRFPPFLAKDLSARNASENDEDTSPYPPEHSIDDVRLAYEQFQARKGGKREVVDRILEGDWRHGITLAQLAMADIRYLEDHPAAQKWTAFRLEPAADKKKQKPTTTATPTEELSACLPRLHAATFLSNLQREISPLVKAHYHLAKSKSFPLTFLRIFVTDSPYQYPRHNPAVYLDSSRVIYIAFPDSSPFIYTSAITTSIGGNASSAAPIGTDSRALRSIVRNAVARALSKQHERYELEATSLTTKSLATLLTLRGPGRTNMANGAFSIFADAVIEGTPIDPRRPDTVSPDEYAGNNENPPQNKNKNEEKDITETDASKRKPLEARDSNDSPATKKRKLVVSSRFGSSGTSASAVALDRLDARLLDRLDEVDAPHLDEHADNSDNDLEVQGYLESGEYAMGLSLTGTNVIAGLRKLAELGMVDPSRMPSWMTGEEGVSSLVARRGQTIVPTRR